MNQFVPHRHLIKPSLFFCLILLLSTLPAHPQRVQHFSEQTLFRNGTGGYACFRIPAILRAGNGDLLAFAEGRRNSCADFGDVDIVMRRSQDNGRSWGALQIVAGNGTLQAGNPAPLLDTRDPRFPDGRLFLLYNTGNNDEYQNRLGNGVREVWYQTSVDHGQTWSTPVNITLQVHRPLNPEFKPAYNFPEDWRSYALTPGHAIQLQRGDFAGRLLVPANHSAGPPQSGFNEYRSHALYSDDHGQTWSVSENVDVPSANEATGVELSDGRVMLNIRQQNGEQRRRLVAISEDGGQTWSRTYFDSTLITPVCEASILRTTTPAGFGVLLFSNPASTDQRRHGTIRLSIDDGRTWSFARTVRSGAFAYSDLVAQEEDFLGCLYEQGNDGSIHYARFNFAWLLGDPPTGAEALCEKLLAEAPGADPVGIALAPPRLRYAHTFLEEPEVVAADLDIPGVEIRYTTRDEGPGLNDSLLPAQGLRIFSNTTLRVRAFHPNYLPSPVVSASFFRVPERVPVQDIQLKYPPSEQYPGRGAQGLIDFEKGPPDFHDRAWMGFNGDDVDCTLELDRPRTLKKLTVSLLSASGSWILPPRSIRIYASQNGKEFQEVDRLVLPETNASDPGGQQYPEIPLQNTRARYLRIVLENQDLPAWHPGAGNPAWIFVDELILE